MKPCRHSLRSGPGGPAAGVSPRPRLVLLHAARRRTSQRRYAAARGDGRPADNPQVVAVGINCIALENTPAALAHLHSLTALPLVVYPNSGEHYDAVSKTWHHHGEACASLADYLPQWLAAGAKLIGGCCRTTRRRTSPRLTRSAKFCRVALRLPGLHIARTGCWVRRSRRPAPTICH